MNSFSAIALPAKLGLRPPRKPWGNATSWQPGLTSGFLPWHWGQISLWPWFGFAGTSENDGGTTRSWPGAGRGGGFDPLQSPPEGSEPTFYHEPVLLQEVLHYLQPGPSSFCFDATLGGGGHTEAMLSHGAQVVALDQDPMAIAHASSRLRAYAQRFCALRGNFRQFPEVLSEIGVSQFDGILADIGVSSKQLDDPTKGFSFMQDGPLDLRMDPDGPVTAKDLINTASEDELVRLFFDYGEEPHAHRIARAIVKARGSKTINTTLELARIIELASPRKGHRHPATLVFQALRIAVNDELGALQDFLNAAPRWLRPGGRLAIISFHSLEDRLVKRALQHYATEFIDRPEWPEPRPNPDYCLRVLTRKPVEASAEELKRNPRARSARLRVAERLPEP